MVSLRVLGSANTNFLILVLTSFLMTTFGSACMAQSSICDEVGSLKLGEYLHGQTDTQLSTLTIRSQGEQSFIGHAAVKGAMARRISGELNGMPVRWSSASLIGPVLCSGFNAFKILVDPRNVRIMDGENRSAVQ
jgi:hypothetical protein